MSKPENWIEKRLAQALFQGVKTNFVANKLMGFDGRIGAGIGEKLVGGTWMTGEVYLTDTAIIFLPNILDKALVKTDSLPEAKISLDAITEIAWRKGLVSKILDIRSEALVISLRGLNLESFSEAVRVRI